MPKFKRPNPKKAVGLNLRAVIEGELMSRLPLPTSYEFISKVADAIEKRIQDGPSDWLSLSNGTTFEKSWVPEQDEESPEEKIGKFGVNRHENLIQLPTAGPTNFDEDHGVFLSDFQEDKLGALGHDSNRLLVKSLDKIHAEHERRVAANKLEHEIQAHEAWLESERTRQ